MPVARGHPQERSLTLLVVATLPRERREPQTGYADHPCSGVPGHVAEARWYAEKLAVPVGPIIDAGIPLRLIDCLRDPRDVLVSIRAFAAATGVDGFGRRAEEPEAQYLPRFISAFADQLDEMAATSPAVDRLTFRYEDFARDPNATAHRLGEWLGLTLDPATARRSRGEFPNHLTTRSVEDSIGRWRSGLTPSEADTNWDGLGSRLERYGYARSLD